MRMDNDIQEMFQRIKLLLDLGTQGSYGCRLEGMTKVWDKPFAAVIQYLLDDHVRMKTAGYEPTFLNLMGTVQNHIKNLYMVRFLGLGMHMEDPHYVMTDIQVVEEDDERPEVYAVMSWMGPVHPDDPNRPLFVAVDLPFQLMARMQPGYSLQWFNQALRERVPPKREAQDRYLKYLTLKEEFVEFEKKEEILTKKQIWFAKKKKSKEQREQESTDSVDTFEFEEGDFMDTAREEEERRIVLQAAKDAEEYRRGVERRIISGTLLKESKAKECFGKFDGDLIEDRDCLTCHSPALCRKVTDAEKDPKKLNPPCFGTEYMSHKMCKTCPHRTPCRRATENNNCDRSNSPIGFDNC